MEPLKLSAIVTGATCGLACWWAREETCRCSCGGRAHGVLALGGTQPRRNCSIGGVRYVLGAVNGSWSAINAWAYEVVHTEYAHLKPGYAPAWRNERGAIWWNKTASDSQMRWPELAATAGDRKPTLEWIREDWADRFDAWLDAQAEK